MLNFADMLEIIEREIDRSAPIFIHGDRQVTWGDAARLSNNLAHALVAQGLRPGDKVALYLRNCPEYLIAVAAAVKARLVPVNVNYRYRQDELRYLLDNADARVVVHGDEFRDTVDAIRAALPGVALWAEVGASEPPASARRFDELTAAGHGDPLAIERSPEDQFFIYTGGTTGLPKGVMWPQGDLREVLVAGARAKGFVPDDLAQLSAYISSSERGPTVLPAPPLMHGTGLLSAVGAMLWGGCVVTLTGKSFDPIEMLEAIHCHRPNALTIVGDSFGRPLLEALDADPDRYDLTSVETITSSGVMWSLEIKRGLLRHMPAAALQDVLASSEALGLGVSVMTAGEEVATATFAIGPRCRVLAEDGSWVAPGAGTAGMLALGPPNPVGYYKDADKTAATFRTIDGVRYCIPGDWCRVEEDGSLSFLGRGNACINTGGEKVFPEEVEEVLKRHPTVSDALVVGAPDDNWGQAIVAVVELRAEADLDAEALRAHVREALAGYKVPKTVVVARDPLRAVNGKADYATARALAIAARNQLHDAN